LLIASESSARYDGAVSRETKVYGHFCLLARAMELLDDRWTVLVVRDLLLGPRRFTDLERRLGGITAKTLQQRLVDLEANGLVTVDRELGRRDVWYSVTDAGSELAVTFDELTAWGVRHLRRPPAADEPVHFEHILSALRVVLDRTPAPPSAITWTFHVDETRSCTLRFDDGAWTYVDEDPGSADLAISASTRAFTDFLTTPPSSRDLATSGLTLTGTKAHQKLFIRLTNRFPFGLD
jgi:DNA-binding HxlR family transcriptional regulator